MRAILLSLLLLTGAATASPVKSKIGACKVLKQKLLPRIPAQVRRTAPGRFGWRCETMEGFENYLIHLHHGRICTNPCSTLYGDFAVRKRDGFVGEWNGDDDRLTPLRPNY